MWKLESLMTTMTVIPHHKHRLVLQWVTMPLAATTLKANIRLWTILRPRGATKILLAHPGQPDLDPGNHQTCPIVHRPLPPRVWRICCPFPSPYRPCPHRLIFAIWTNHRQSMVWDRFWSNCVWAVVRPPRQDSSQCLLPNDGPQAICRIKNPPLLKNVQNIFSLFPLHIFFF